MYWLKRKETRSINLITQGSLNTDWHDWCTRDINVSIKYIKIEMWSDFSRYHIRDVIRGLRLYSRPTDHVTKVCWMVMFRCSWWNAVRNHLWEKILDMCLHLAYVKQPCNQDEIHPHHPISMSLQTTKGYIIISFSPDLFHTANPWNVWYYYIWRWKCQ